MSTVPNELYMYAYVSPYLVLLILEFSSYPNQSCNPILLNSNVTKPIANLSNKLSLFYYFANCILLSCFNQNCYYYYYYIYCQLHIYIYITQFQYRNQTIYYIPLKLQEIHKILIIINIVLFPVASL